MRYSIPGNHPIKASQRADPDAFLSAVLPLLRQHGSIDHVLKPGAAFQGNADKDLRIVVAGRIGVFRCEADAPNEELALAVLTRGDTFNQAAALETDPDPFTYVALEDAQVLRVGSALLRGRNPGVALTVARALDRLMRRTLLRLADERVAREKERHAEALVQDALTAEVNAERNTGLQDRAEAAVTEQALEERIAALSRRLCDQANMEHEFRAQVASCLMDLARMHQATADPHILTNLEYLAKELRTGPQTMPQSMRPDEAPRSPSASSKPPRPVSIPPDAPTHQSAVSGTTMRLAFDDEDGEVMVDVEIEAASATTHGDRPTIPYFFPR